MTDDPFPFRIRPATHKDVPALEDLIEASVRGLGPRRYSAQQIERSLDRLFGVDTQLIDDGTYFAVETTGASSGGRAFDASSGGRAFDASSGGRAFDASSGGRASDDRVPRIVGAGGWSRRKTPFGGDHATPHQDAALRDPAADPAVIRAFFVHPDWTRRGIGQQILQRCETEAKATGFTRFELTATLTGLPLYAAHGYREQEPIDIPLGETPDGHPLTLKAVRMTKTPGEKA